MLMARITRVFPAQNLGYDGTVDTPREIHWPDAKGAEK